MQSINLAGVIKTLVLAFRQHFNSDQLRRRHYWRNMDCSILQPPETVRGICELDREAFRKRVQIPRLRVHEHQLNKVLPLVKKYLLKMERMRPVRTVKCEESSTDDDKALPHLKEILLHPMPVKNWDSLPVAEFEPLQIEPSSFGFEEIELGYANWRADEIFKSVLPSEQEGLTSYSCIGHIIHINLREHLLPYKALIGQVLLDKITNCKTVVNKVANIDNTYRNFQLELICGEPNYQVETKENGIPFEFDFSRVYWNPRLSTEHERIVQMLRPGDVLYDVFAGVGPFSVPAAKKRCTVLANDLNPESFHWLQHNAKRNKCTANITFFNRDGRDFILEDVKEDLLKRWTREDGNSNDPTSAYTIHITMNLPGMAVEFLDAFRGLFHNETNTVSNFTLPSSLNLPIVHVYSFAKGENTKSLVQEMVETHLGMPLNKNLQGIEFVRNVAPKKDMYRISFRLTAEILNTPIMDIKSRKRHGSNNDLDDDVLSNSKVICN